MTSCINVLGAVNLTQAVLKPSLQFYMLQCGAIELVPSSLKKFKLNNYCCKTIFNSFKSDKDAEGICFSLFFP